MNLILERDYLGETFTQGSLYGFGQRIAYTCEDRVRGDADPATVKEWKVPGSSAIPLGQYKVIVSYSGRFKKHLPELLDVPGFTAIRLHAGNNEHHTEGCPLLGLSLSKDGVRNCAPAMKKLMDLLAGAKERNEEVWLQVCNA